MVKKLLPILLIIFVWFIFSKPFFIDNKIPFPADLAVNNYSLWSSYEKYWSPVKNPAQPDVISQIMPWKKLTIESLKQFQIPFWNPYSFSGTPHLANYQSSPFSITNLFYFIFNFKIAWSLAVIVQPLLAGIFTYAFVRSLKKSQIASIIASISFMFSGFMTTWMSYTTLSLAICFLPLALFSIERYTHTNKFKFLLLLSLTFPLSFFSGHFQTSIYFSIFIFSYIIFKFIDQRDKKNLIYSIVFSFLGIFLTMPQIIPSIELYSLSFRSSIFQKIEAIPIKYLMTILYPDYYGNPVTRNNYFGHYAEWASFFGIISFYLAFFSIFKKNKYVIFFLITGVISLLLSIDTFILDSLIRLKIPVISTSAASRIIVLFSFSFSVLASFGTDLLKENIEKNDRKKIYKWLILSSLILVFTWLLTLGKVIDTENYLIAIKNMILPTLLFALMIIGISFSIFNKKLIKISLIIILFIIIFDLLRFSIKWQSYSEPDLLFPKTQIIENLQKQNNIFRTLGKFSAEGSVYYKISSTEGYDPLYINRYGQLIGSLNNGKIAPSPRSGVSLQPDKYFAPKIFDFLGIKYVLEKKLDEDKVWGFPFEKYANKFNLIYKDKEFSIFENKDVYNRAFIVSNFTVQNNDQKIIDTILNDNFDLKNSVVLEKTPVISSSSLSTGSAKIISYNPNKIIVDTKTKDESILVLTDNYFPGWSVKVNGTEKEVLRADYTFKAVVIPKGESTVEFYFESKSFKLGVYLAILSLLIILILMVGKWYTTKNNKKHGRRK